MLEKVEDSSSQKVQNEDYNALLFENYSQSLEGNPQTITSFLRKFSNIGGY